MLMGVTKIAFKSNPTLAAGMISSVLKPITSFAKYHNSKDADGDVMMMARNIIIFENIQLSILLL